MKLKIPILFGTSRINNATSRVADYIFKQTIAYGFDSTMFKPEDILTTPRSGRLSDTGESNPWQKEMAQADGLIIVSPEYNHGYPGELKLMLDMLYDEYENKPVAIIGAGGKIGGGRMVEQLRQVAIELHLIPVNGAMYFYFVGKAFDESGSPVDKEYDRRCVKLFDELSWFAQALKRARK